MVLAWHVDYWDRLGWKDPFGSRAASARQSAYAKAWSEKQRWTPQWRVEGQSLRGRGLGPVIQTKVREAIVLKPRVALEATATWTPPENPAEALPTVTAVLKLRLLKAEDALPKTARILPVLIQRKATTKVPAGENAGKTLTEYYGVCTIGKPMALKDALSAKGATLTLAAPKGQKPSNLGLAVIVEDAAKMHPIESRFVAVTKKPRAPEKAVGR